MTVSRWQRARPILRGIGVAIGILLFLMECFDALVTPRPDWLWFGAAILLIWLCRPFRSVAG